MNYEQIKQKLLSKGIFVLDKKRPVKEIRYLVDCGYKILYSRFGSYYLKYHGKCVCYVPVIIDSLILKDLNDEVLYKEFKQISYNPKTIIEYFQKNLL